MNIDPQQPDWPERDRLILSKGHCAGALYTTLAMRGFFPVEDLFFAVRIRYPHRNIVRPGCRRRPADLPCRTV